VVWQELALSGSFVVGHGAGFKAFNAPSHTATVQVCGGLRGPPAAGIVTDIVAEPTSFALSGVVLLLEFWYVLIQSPLKPKVTFRWYTTLLACITTFTLTVELAWAAVTDPLNGSVAPRSTLPRVTVIVPVWKAWARGMLVLGSASPRRSRDMLATSIFLLCMATAFG